jgi:glycosyltransferase involved in cell wall biosynthesis
VAKSRYRVAYLVSHPIQYQAPLLRYLSDDKRLDLVVFFMSDISLRAYHDNGFGIAVNWDVPLTEGYSHRFLQSRSPKGRISWFRPFVHLPIRDLKADGFDVVWIHGYAHQACLRAIWSAKRAGLKVLLRGESHLCSHPRSDAKSMVKHFGIPRIFDHIDGFLAIGSMNRRYYLHYGVPPERIFEMPYAVDNAFFQRLAQNAEPNRESLRSSLGLEPNRPVILYASKFETRKRPDVLLDAYRQLSSDGVSEPDPYLLFIGDGKERTSIQATAHSLGWSCIKFLGFKNQTELPQYYDLCDVFVLPSEFEPWGLVVNEVMNAGKAVIVSNRVGAGPDLVKEGLNGYIVPVGDVKALSDRLRFVTSNPDVCKKMGRESLKQISAWSFDVDLNGFIEAVVSVVEG